MLRWSPEAKHAARIAGLYAMVALLWIIFSDRVLGILVADPTRLTVAQSLKGSLFVLVSSGVIYVLIRSAMESVGRSRAKLRNTEDLVQLVAQHTSAAIWAYNADFTEALYLSPSAETVWGKPLLEMYRNPTFYMDQIHPADRPTVIEALNHTSQVTVEYRVFRENGEVRWLHTIGNAVRDRAGNIVRVVGITEDVTEEKMVERARQETEERFRATFEQAAVGMGHVDAKGRWLRVNDRLCEIMGYSRDELLARTFQEITHPEDLGADVEQGERLRAGEISRYSLEKRYIRKDGSTIWVNLTGSLASSASGDPAYFIRVVEDIGERRRAESELRDTRERFHQLADNIPQVFWISSIDKDQVLYVSKAYETVWGRSRPELRDWPDQWRQSIQPEDRARVVAAAATQVEGTYDEEYRILRPDGEVRWVRDQAFPVCDERGQPYRVAGIAEDITDRRHRSENLLLLAAVVEQAAEGVLITDAAGTIEYVNPAFEKVTGYDRGEALGKNPRMLKSGKQGAAFYHDLWSTLLAGQPWRGRLVNRRKDGKLYTQETILTPVRTGGGETSHIVGVFSDVTQELRLAEQFRQAQKMEAIGRLAGGIAHDFNNVLTAITGHAQFALEDLPDDSGARDDLQEIVDAADRASNLTRHMLAFSRQQVSDPVVLDLGEAIQRAKRMLARLIGDHVAFNVSVAPDLGRVLADPTQVEQVLTNLVVNALDAMPDGGRLTIEASNVELETDFTHRFPYPVRPGAYVRLAVSDTGSGMDADTLERIFEPFFTTKERDKGTGLGLSTVYGIVKQAGGYIWAYSEPGQGSTFKIYFPQTERELLPPDAVRPESTDYTGSATVLVVEDQPSVRSLVRRGLERAGYRVFDATNGAEALQIIQQDDNPVDLLLTDVVMPEMGGRELAARLRQLRPEIRVLFMSGYPEHEIAQRGILEPNTHFLEKPFEPRALQRKVREVLSGTALTAR